jgi:alkylation response protein AidB-like acyl-CoA dehydrogenase
VRFAFTEDQDELRGTVRAFLERHATPRVVRDAAEHGSGFAPEAWRRVVGEMELASLAINPACGGAGATFVEVGIALEELGRALLPIPLLPTVVAASAIGHSGNGGERDHALERISAGAIATVALSHSSARATRVGDGFVIDGELAHVCDGAHADLVVLSAESSGQSELFLVETDAAGVSIERRPTLDRTRSQAKVRLAATPALRLGPVSAVERACDLLGVALAAEAVGAAARSLETTIQYLKERVQFGRPIGSFQALKHRCADLALALETARSTAYYAAWAVNGAPHELASVAPVAQLVCGQAFLRIAAESIQLHGGIGFTWEHDAHLYFKRAKSSELLFGGASELRRLVARRAGIS